MKRISLPQGSPEWLSWRRERLTASECAIISGSSPWGGTPLQLWKRKRRLLPEIQQTEAMARGNSEEPNARRALEAATGIHFSPSCYESDCGGYGCSLDGESFDGKTLCELKVPQSEKSSLWEYIRAGKAPEYYLDQMRQQCWVKNDAEVMLFGVYDYQSGRIEHMSLDAGRLHAEFEERLLKPCAEFVQCLREGVEPERIDADVEHRDDDAWYVTATKYRRAKQAADTATEHLNNVKAELLKLADGRSSEGAGVRAVYYQVAGSLDSKKLQAEAQQQGIDPEKFRKPSRTQTRITMTEENE